MSVVLLYLNIVLLSFAQNIAFSLVSRARNRNNFWYHLIAAVFSNIVWFLTFRVLVTQNMTWSLLVPYTIGTVSGSLFGAQISMKIEKWLGATSDGHMK